jgi:uncharacterized protein DUF2795
VDELLAALEKLDYPATKAQLIERLAAGGADDATLARVAALPNERYDRAEDVSLDLFRRRAESNPSLVTITPEACPRCGFPRVPGEPHSCIEEKARFAEAAQSVTDEFEIPRDAGRDP